MPFTATYDATRSEVALAASGVAVLPATTASIVIDRYGTAVLTNPVAVRGGAQAATTASTIALKDREFVPGVVNTYRLRAYNGAAGTGTLLATTTATVTPAPTATWLRSPTRPFLDQAVTVVEASDLGLPARAGTFEVLGRRLPVALTEVRGSRRYSLTLATMTAAERAALELFFSFGDVVLFQPPAGCDLPGPLYAAVGDVTVTRGGNGHASLRRYFVLPLVEVAAPDASIVGATITYAGAASTWPTYTAMNAATASYAALAAYVAAPLDEVVG